MKISDYWLEALILITLIGIAFIGVDACRVHLRTQKISSPNLILMTNLYPQSNSVDVSGLDWPKLDYKPAHEFVRITDRNGTVYMFRPHMVCQIVSETNGCKIVVAGIGSIPMNCSVDVAAKLVQDR